MKQLELIDNPKSGAIFNKDRSHRFVLHRIWDEEKPYAMVIGLNPSTAEETKPDPTITRLSGPKGILANNGYGGLFMVNLFSYVTPYPAQLVNPASCTYDEKKTVELWKDIYCDVSDHNAKLQSIKGLYKLGDPIPSVPDYKPAIIFAWGNFDCHGRDKLAIAKYSIIAFCFGKNQNGSPKHPLYLKGTTKIEPWK